MSESANRRIGELRITNYVLRFAFYVLLALLAAAPLWGPGMVNTRGGGDSPFLLQRTLDMAESLRYGIFPVRWMAHAAYDLGYPFFNHYAALPYYLSGGLTVLGLSPLVAIQATQTFGFVLAALAMALWAERVFKSRAAALVVVAAYTFAPFHLVNIYVRGDSLSEFYAFVWYPLILWTLDRVAERPTRGRIIAASLAYGALILTHNTSALIFSPFALLYAVLRIANQRMSESANERIGESANPKSKIQNLKYLVVPFVLGFLFTAWFWLPAMAETKYGQMGPEFTAGYFHYSNHFRGLDLVQRTFTFDYSVAPSAEDAGPFAMGLVQAALALVGVVSLVSNVQSRKLDQRISESANEESANHESPVPNPHSPLVYLIFSLALATFMITPLSKPLWDNLPLLEITQFPWRFLSVQALFTAMATGAIVDLPIFKSRNLKTVVTAGLCGLLITAALLGLHPERLLISDEDVTWENLLLYETFTGNIGTTIRYEYLPRDVSPRLYISEAVVDGKLRPIADGGGLLAWDLLERTPVKQEWQVTVDAGGATVAFPLNWWPGWQAEVDGERVDTSPMAGSGRLTVVLPAGEHNITLRLHHTQIRLLAEILSALTMMGLVVWAFMRRKSRLRITNHELRIANPPPSTVYCLLSTAFVLSLLLPALLHRAPAASATFFDFNQMPYPHAGPVDFGVVRLEDVTLSATTVRPGESLTVQHTWSAVSGSPLAGPLTGTLRLVSPAEPRYGIPYELAETAFALPCDGACATTLVMPDDLSRGLYLLEMRVGEDAVYVGAVRVPHGPSRRTDAPVLAEFRDVTLHAVEPIQPDPTTLRLKMVWSTAGTPRNWSLSLRLLDASGRQLVQHDNQPGYGYLPTTLWLPGETVIDYPVLTLPEGLAPGEYTLRVITYLLATGETGEQADIPIRLTAATLYDLQDPYCEQACAEQVPKGTTILCQAGGVALLGTDLPEQLTEGNSLDFYGQWNAVAVPTTDLTARWDVLDAAGTIVGSAEGPLAPGSRTSEWPLHAWVYGPVHIDLPPVLSPGAYDVRLTLADAVCTFRGRLTVTPRPRVFDAPPISHPLEADFGSEIRLLGYDWMEERNTLTLTLWWRATATPRHDYKRFIHIYEPTTEIIVAQDDAMPRAWTYPTSFWVAGEVVSETVTLDLGDAPKAWYRVAVGWYDPDTVIRLPARDTNGQPALLDRIVLEEIQLSHF
jgi:hypothetical protein